MPHAGGSLTAPGTALVLLVGLVLLAASVRFCEGRVHAYCQVGSAHRLLGDTKQERAMGPHCKNLGYFEAMIAMPNNICFAACDDDIERLVVPVVWHSLQRWLTANATVFEAPNIIEDQAAALLGNAPTAADHTAQAHAMHRTNWTDVHRLHHVFKRARVFVPLHVSSSRVFEKAKRRLQELYVIAIHRFDAQTVQSNSPLRDVVDAFFPSGLPTFERYWPHQMMLPTFVTYTYTVGSCPTCAQGLAAFHRLLVVFRHLCVHNHRAVAGCSPVTFFAAYPVDTFLSVVPQVALVKYPLVHIGPTGAVKEGRRAQRISDVMNPFSYHMEHTSLLFDFLSFLIVNEVVQLRYLSAAEAQVMRLKLQEIEARKAKLEAQAQLPESSNSSLDGKGEGAEDAAGLALQNSSVEEARRLDEEAATTGKVRSVHDLIVFVIRSLEASVAEDPSPSSLSVYARWYDFPSPWQSKQDIAHDQGLWSSLTPPVCDCLSVVWLCLFVWVIVHLIRRR